MQLTLGITWQKSILLCSAFKYHHPFSPQEQRTTPLTELLILLSLTFSQLPQSPFCRSLFWGWCPWGTGSVLSESGLSQRAGRAEGGYSAMYHAARKKRQAANWLVSFWHLKRQIWQSMQTAFPLVSCIICPTNYCGFFFSILLCWVLWLRV